MHIKKNLLILSFTTKTVSIRRDKCHECCNKSCTLTIKNNNNNARQHQQIILHNILYVYK